MNLLRILIAAIVSAAVLLVAPLASAGGQASPATPHKHFLELPDGTWIPVGPDVCANPNLQTAFNQFHAAVHVGPANTAFDHAHNPVDIKFGGLC